MNAKASFVDISTLQTYLVDMKVRLALVREISAHAASFVVIFPNLTHVVALLLHLGNVKTVVVEFRIVGVRHQTHVVASVWFVLASGSGYIATGALSPVRFPEIHQFLVSVWVLTIVFVSLKDAARSVSRIVSMDPRLSDAMVLLKNVTTRAARERIVNALSFARIHLHFFAEEPPTIAVVEETSVVVGVLVPTVLAERLAAQSNARVLAASMFLLISLVYWLPTLV